MNIEIIEKKEMPSIETAVVISTWKMPFAIGRILRNINRFLHNNNIRPADAPYVRYLNLDWESLEQQNARPCFLRCLFQKWDLRIGFPLEEKIEDGAVQGNEKISPSIFPRGKYLKTVHKGPYKKVSSVYTKMLKWAGEHNFQVLPESAEIYMNDPRTVKQKDLETAVLIPVDE